MENETSPKLKLAKANCSWKVFDYLAIVAIFLFSIWRFQDIYYPYLHDEVDVYGQGALYMHDHSLTLLPGVIPPELSRGHPLLFYALYGLAFKAFGPTVEVAHSLSLIISLIFLACAYFFPTRFFGKPVAFCSLLILITNPMMISQSTLVHPEVLLALLTLCAIYFYLKKNSILYLFFCTLGVLTKETAIILPSLIVVINFLPYTRYFHAASRIEKATLFIPILVFIAFFSIQRSTNGWFFFPLHVNYISLNFIDLISKFSRTVYFFGVAQGRVLISLIFVLGIFVSFKTKLLKRIPENELNVLLLLIAYIFLVVSFSCLNFLINRYFMLILSPISLIISYILNSLVKNKTSRSVIITIIAISPSIFFIQNKKKFNFDVDLNYQYFIENQSELFQHLDSSDLYNNQIYVNYPLFESNEDPRYGYVRKKFNLRKEFNHSTEYMAISNIDIYDYYHPAKDKVELIRVFKKEYSIISLYKVKK